MLWSIVIFYLILVVANLPAPFVGMWYESKENPKFWYSPPGWVIPIIWLVLFTLLGIARHNLILNDAKQYQWWLFGLAFLCSTYPYYTIGIARSLKIPTLWFGLGGNVLVIISTLIVYNKILSVSLTAAYLIIPVAFWTFYSSIIVLAEMKYKKLI